MLRAPKTDVWRPALVRAPVSAALRPAEFAKAELILFPEEPAWRYLADPFGIWRGDKLYVFAEAYDYRVRRAHIEALELDAAGRILRRGPALADSAHLSYPFLIEDDGVLYMMPEAHRAGPQALYVCEAFPFVWRKCAVFDGLTLIDASPVKSGGLWWMFASLPGKQSTSALHVFFAERLTGPWRAHEANPVRRGADSSRMGGTPFVHDGALHLPVQDCSASYGGGLHVLRVNTLTPARFEAQITATLLPPAGAGAYADGLHTLSAAGPVTLIDVKRRLRSWRRYAVDAARPWRAWRGG